MKNPLDVDPECSQFAKLLLKQSEVNNFGFSNRQIGRINRTEKGAKLWKTLTETCFRDFPGKGRRFDFSLFCRELCDPEFSDTRRCFKVAKEQYPHLDSRKVCFVQVWDLCKRIEHVWTNVHVLAGS
jgi:hypothetical protein